MVKRLNLNFIEEATLVHGLKKQENEEKTDSLQNQLI